MKKFFKNMFPAEFHTNPAYWRAFVLGLVYLALAITQLFTFEDFHYITSGYGFPGDAVTAALIAGFLPIVEVGSLPYLFSMKLSNRWRNLSKLFAVVLPAAWLVIALWTNITGNAQLEAGIFGATIPASNGLWLIAFASTLLWAALLVRQELPQRTK